MNVPDVEVHVSIHDGFVVDTDPSRLDLVAVHEWLSTDTYLATGRSLDAVSRAADASVNFGVYDSDGKQVGYARVVTDGVTLGWLCDVYIAREVRGRGIGTALSKVIVDAIRPLGLRRFMLSTVDAHEIYAGVGFVPCPDPQKLMTLDTQGRR